ncbi:hypothetical protein AB3M91_20345 [Solibacillus isronensis]
MTNKFIEQRVNVLENELSELKLIVAQIRMPSTVVEGALANDIIEFEGKQYKKVDREAEIGDIAIINQNNGKLSEWFTVGKVYRVVDWLGNIGVEADFHGKFLLYAEDYGRTPETVDVYELMDGYNPGIVMVDETPRPTANQLRAEIIEKAKGFVEKYLNACKSIFATHEGNGLLSEWGMSPKFEINSKKRAIVVLLYRTAGGNLVGKGIAKCDPSDVFNEHIGKAIALGRALGLDVREFEQAVQPTEFLIGHVVTYTSDEAGTFKGFEEEIASFDGKNIEYTNGESYDLKGEDWGIKIINDTNAQYLNEVTK